MRILLLSFALLPIIFTETLASDAYVLAEEEIGQGFFRPRGAECFFITAGHVVSEAAEIELITSGRLHLSANVITSYPDDVAILRVELPKNTTCPKGSWGTGEKLKTLLNIEQEGVIKTRLNDGSTLQTAVNIKTFDDFRYIQVIPKDTKTQFAKGFSGSPLFISGQPAGILQSVSKGVGKVFRQDALSNTVALFFNADLQEITTPSKKNHKKTTSQTVTQISATSIEFKGSLAKNQIVKHTFVGKKNTPVLIINPTRSKGFWHTLEILNSRKKVLASYKHNRGRAREIPFTPSKDDTYTIQLVGANHYGDYSLSLKQIATSEQLTGKANIIGIDETVDGSLAIKATAQYRFAGKTNSPVVIINPARTNGLWHTIEILNSRKKVLASYKHNRGRAREIPFTPPKDDTYTIQLVGTNHYGNYSLSLNQIATDEQLTGKANVIGIDETVEGSLALNATAQYRFAGKTNSPVVIINPARTNRLWHTIEILNSRKKVLASHKHNRGRIREIPFTPPKDDTYTIQLVGINHYGDFSISVVKP